MPCRFEKRFESELQKIALSVGRKGGTKNATNVHDHIGRAGERYPSGQYYYNIHVDNHTILLIKPKPFAKRKSVVHKPELKKNEM